MSPRPINKKERLRLNKKSGILYTLFTPISDDQIPKDYERNPIDARQLLPMMPQCIYRELLEKKKCCGGSIPMRCQLFSKLVNRLTCHNCKEYKSV